MRTHDLIIALFQRFCWLDEGLQARLHDRGWPDVSRAQSMVMVHIVSGVVRPSDIARNMGISRQAIHGTLAQMAALGMLTLEDDPVDRRHKVARLTAFGEGMRHDAQEAMAELGGQIAQRIGERKFGALLAALEADWGESVAE